ncbi:MAG: bifunctional 4-hydroxy-3-methylbut-2-enyl diphosphate reductase/30S ribosomal protein S1 [Clostridia bacterium]|nr:bifunctional 4-hydroxy-3-methylbut-2-enyl diphosphate reductase/30S ribosomal protein S1 [Clostridia bacterium]
MNNKHKATITLAKTAGFCFGVNRAVNMVNGLLEQGNRVATLGPIIHNKQVVDELQAKGVAICENPEEISKDTTLVIRSHGVSKQVYDFLDFHKIAYCDATCPFVEKIHKIVQTAAQNNQPVLIAGDSEHPEILGIRGFAGEQVFCYQSTEELIDLLKNNIFLRDLPIVSVCQTTFDKKLWEKCEKILKKYCTSAVFFDTICDATSKRQQEAEALAHDSDLMIVVGGRHSSNTVKLYSICQRLCPTLHIESADELDRDYVSGFRRIGVTAGASTPSGIIKEVQQTMSEIIDNVETTEANASINEQEMPATQESEVAQEMPAAAENTTQSVQAESTVDEEPPVPEKSFDEMTDMEAFEYSLNQMNSDQRVKGYVLAVTPTEIQVDIGRKHAGFVPMSEYSYDSDADAMSEVKVGDILDLIVMRTNDQEGTVMLSKKRFDSTRIWDNLIEAQNNGTILEGKVTEVIKGGILVVSKGIRVFVPASQATASRNDSLEDMLHTTVQFRILEVNRARRRAVGSIRSVLRDQRKEQESAFWGDIAEGKVFTGKVKSLTSYGAFVDLGGVDGMVHISELSWKRIKNPSEVVKVGDIIEVFVKSFDAEKKKVSLGYKKAEDNPWAIFMRDYKLDDVVNVKIVSMTTYGAFANITDGVDGLIHISQIANSRIAKPQDVLEIGQQVDAKIIQIDEEKKRISLSIRVLLDDEPVAEEAVAEEAATEEVAE